MLQVSGVFFQVICMVRPNFRSAVVLLVIGCTLSTAQLAECSCEEEKSYADYTNGKSAFFKMGSRTFVFSKTDFASFLKGQEAQLERLWGLKERFSEFFVFGKRLDFVLQKQEQAIRELREELSKNGGGNSPSFDDFLRHTENAKTGGKDRRKDIFVTDPGISLNYSSQHKEADKDAQQKEKDYTTLHKALKEYGYHGRTVRREEEMTKMYNTVIRANPALAQQFTEQEIKDEYKTPENWRNKK